MVRVPQRRVLPGPVLRAEVDLRRRQRRAVRGLHARPATLPPRFRWDYGNNLTQPDRAEYFWAAIGQEGAVTPGNLA